MIHEPQENNQIATPSSTTFIPNFISSPDLENLQNTELNLSQIKGQNQKMNSLVIKRLKTEKNNNQQQVSGAGKIVDASMTGPSTIDVGTSTPNKANNNLNILNVVSSTPNDNMVRVEEFKDDPSKLMQMSRRPNGKFIRHSIDKIGMSKIKNFNKTMMVNDTKLNQRIMKEHGLIDKGLREKILSQCVIPTHQGGIKSNSPYHSPNSVNRYSTTLQ